jgi:hypothetical protein
MSDHTLTLISTWAEVAILLFMVWEAYGPSWWRGMTNLQSLGSPPVRTGFVARLWDNHTLIVAAAGLIIVGWLYLSRPDTENLEAQKSTLIEWLQQAQLERNQARQERDTARPQLAEAKRPITNPVAPAVPVPPKKFYSQMQKDELADMLQAAISLFDKENSEILTINTIFMPQSHMAPSKTITVSEQNAALDNLGDKIISYEKEIYKFTNRYEEFYNDELHFIGLPELTNTLTSLEYAVKQTQDRLKPIQEEIAQYPNDARLQNMLRQATGQPLNSFETTINNFTRITEAVKQKANIMRQSLIQ